MNVTYYKITNKNKNYYKDKYHSDFNMLYKPFKKLKSYTKGGFFLLPLRTFLNFWTMDVI